MSNTTIWLSVTRYISIITIENIDGINFWKILILIKVEECKAQGIIFFISMLEPIEK